MNVAIGIGTLMLTGWVMPTPDRPTDQPVAPLGAPLSDTPMGLGRPRDDLAPRGRLGGGPSDSTSPYRHGTGRTGYGVGERDVYREPYVPAMPTDPSLGDSDSPWAPPTDSSSTTVPGFGSRPYAGPRASPSGSYRQAPNAYQYRGRAPQRTSTARSASEIAAQQQQQARIEAMSRSNSALQAGKPFANYTPQSGVSPYMNLFRRDTGGIDNYSTFVRPELEQRRANQVIGGEIRGLQSATRLQNSVMHRMGKQGQTLGGTNVPEFFMNHRQFYSGFSR